MDIESKRPVLVALTSYWVSMLGFGLVTTARFSWLFILPIQVRGHINNPFTGISLNALSQDLAHQHWAMDLRLATFAGLCEQCKERFR
jgi:hypothetical protein